MKADFESLPEWLVADDNGDRDFVIHCHYPKFIMEIEGGRGEPIFIDSESDFIANEQSAGREPAQSLAALMRQAGDFFMSTMEDEE